MACIIRIIKTSLLIAALVTLNGCATYVVSGIGLSAKYGYVPKEPELGLEPNINLYEGSFTGAFGVPYDVFYLDKERVNLGIHPYREVRNKKGELVAVNTDVGEFKASQDKEYDRHPIEKNMVLVESRKRSPLGYAAQILQVVAAPIDLIGGTVFLVIYSVSYWVQEARSPY